jgi:hypothetical protein
MLQKGIRFYGDLLALTNGRREKDGKGSHNYRQPWRSHLTIPLHSRNVFSPNRRGRSMSLTATRISHLASEYLIAMAAHLHPGGRIPSFSMNAIGRSLFGF